ncbi:sulfatase [Ruficoccus amylovorans]|uniref:Sulfatase n=1 Tax=Ruficoccus amylovorans TaxID=1804625 RepID=A0A842HDR1_9BACT|nr:sulfatase [Ruficoccus amylovorans]MBC2593674.1 sulfatase [Ruficoccus amylovorans]
MILVDDLGYADLTCYGSDLYQTPNVDAFAQESIRFTNAYTAAPICSPTRASIVTGKHPARLHLTDWIPGHKHENTKLLVPDWQKSLPKTEKTIGNLLREQGYATAWFGKWHLHGATQDFGFDAGEQDWALNEGKSQNDPKGVFQLTEQALDFINHTGDKPFFVCVSHYTVHTPVRFNNDVKKKYDALVTPENKQQNTRYAAMVEAMDDSIGLLLEGLEKSGKAGNTIVIFYSDNGGLEKLTSNAPMRAGKATLYEGGIRVPMIVRMPDGAGAGTVSDEIVTSTDLLPTFLDIAGAPEKSPADVDGVSLLSMWSKGEELDREEIYWHYPHYHITNPAGAVRKDNYKLIEYFEDGKLELYDLEIDPSETKNLADKMPEKTQELLNDLRVWREEVGAQMMSANPNYVEK